MVTETRRRKVPEWDLLSKAREEWLGGMVEFLLGGVDADPEALGKTKEYCKLLLNLDVGVTRASLDAWTMGALFEVARGFYDGYLLATKPAKYRAWYSNFKVV